MPAVPLTNVQADILRLLASQRDPESDVAGSTPINRNAPRYSGGIYIFHDREERVARAAAEDSALLEREGYTLQWIRREPNIYTVLAKRFNGSSRATQTPRAYFGNRRPATRSLAGQTLDTD